MATVSNIKVAVESAINDAIRDLANNIYKEYGIRVGSCSFDWLDVSTIEKQEYITGSISTTMATDDYYHSRI